MQSLNRVTGVRLTYKVTAAIMVLVFVSVSLVGVLSYYKYKSILNSLILSRAEVTVASLQSTVQAPLQLGLSLADVRTITGVLERTQARDPLIARISVFEATPGGRILYSTDADLIGHPPPAEWLSAVSGRESIWQRSAADGETVGTRLVDRLDQPVGGVALTYKQSYADSRLAFIGDELINYGVIIIGGVVVVAFVMVQIFFRPITRHLNTLTARTLGVSSDHTAVSDGGDEIDRSFSSFEAGAAKADAALDALEDAVASAERADAQAAREAAR